MPAPADMQWVPGGKFRMGSEWERAARGGLEAAIFAWGDEPFPDGRPMANRWQDEFPSQDPLEDGYEGPCCTPRAPSDPIPSRVLKGGSHLCAPNYCLRDRPAARQPEAVGASTRHIGFRCIVRSPNG